MASIRHKVEEARIIREGNYIEANLRKQALGEIRRKFGSGQGSFPEDIGTSRRDLHTSSAVYDEGNKNPRHASLDPKDLFDQIDKGNVESVMAIMSNPDIDHYVNKVDKHGRNALHYAVLSRDPKMVEAVLNCKDFIIGGFRDHSGNTALHYAASFGNHAIVEILVNKEFDINDYKFSFSVLNFLNLIQGKKLYCDCFIFIEST